LLKRIVWIISLRVAVVTVRHNGQGRDLGGLRAAAHLDGQLLAGLGLVWRDEAHGDRAAEAGGEAAAGDDADRLAAGPEDRRALPGRRAVEPREPDPQTSRAVGQFPGDALGAAARAGLQPLLGDREAEIGLDRRDGGVEVVAIERQAGLEPQGIPGPQADRPDPLVGQQPVPQGLGAALGDEDLEAVFAGVAAARHPHRDALERPAAVGHEAHGVDFGEEAAEHIHRLRALQGDEAAVVGPAQPRLAAGRLGDQLEIGFLAAGVDDDVEPALEIRIHRPADHQVVEDAALFVEQQGVAHLARLQAGDIAADQGFDEGGHRPVPLFRVAAGGGEIEEGRAHVRDVEEAGVLPRPQVLLEDAHGVLHRHVIAAERRHAGAGRHVGVMQDGELERIV
jgi:hypothetical protein